MKYQKNILIALTLVLFGCGGSGGGSSGPTAGAGQPEAGVSKVEVKSDESAIEIMKVMLKEYSEELKSIGQDEVQQGLLVGEFLSKAGFKELNLATAKYVYNELTSKGLESNPDFTETAKELLKLKNK